MSYNPGDVLVYSLQVGSFEFAQSFLSFKVWESVFTPGVVASIILVDTEDYIGRQKLSGGESVVLNFQAPGTKTLNYNLIVNKIKKTTSPGQNSKTYEVLACSKEVINSKDKYVSKVYDKKTYSDMVKDVFQQFLKSDQKIDVEDTKGMHKFVVPNLKPFQAIDALRRRSVSNNNKSSTYVFFANHDGFHFKTLEQLFKGSSVKSFGQNYATGSDFLRSPATNIIAYEVPKQMSLARSAGAGVFKSKYNTFNFHTLDYKQKEQTKPESGTTKGGGERYKESTASKHNSTPGYIAVMPVSNEKDTGLRQKSNIPEATPTQRAYADAMASTTLKMTVIGDTNLKAGDVVTANILKKQDSTGPRDNDSMISGKFLISALEHNISTADKRPRYTCILNCAKGGYEQGVQEGIA